MNATKHYAAYFQQWQWEWGATLTFREPVSFELARRQLLQWNRNLSTTEHIQTAFIAVLNSVTWNPHWHLLIFGKKKKGRTLLDISTKKWERRWPAVARIELVRDNRAVSNYLARNMTLWNPDKYDLETHNQKLLKSAEKRIGEAGKITPLKPAAV